jgi:predicted RNA binding protein YcfA (HicA-like mRNA interferase family)
MVGCHLHDLAGKGHSVGRREKLLQKMRNSPTGIRFAEVVSLLQHEGFVLFNRRGSHCTFHRADERLLTIVRPHGSRNTCHPADIRKLLEALER